MATRRRIGRRRLVDPGIALHSVSNLLFEIECLSSSVELRDIQNYILRLEAMNTNLRRLPSSVVAHSTIDQIIHGLDEINTLFEAEREHQALLLRRGYITPRVHTGFPSMSMTLKLDWFLIL